MQSWTESQKQTKIIISFQSAQHSDLNKNLRREPVFWLNNIFPGNGHLATVREQSPATLAACQASASSHFPLVMLYVTLMY